MNFVSLYCVAASVLDINREQRPERVTHYTDFISKFNTDGFDFPFAAEPNS